MVLFKFAYCQNVPKLTSKKMETHKILNMRSSKNPPNHPSIGWSPYSTIANLRHGKNQRSDYYTPLLQHPGFEPGTFECCNSMLTTDLCCRCWQLIN